MMKLHLLVATAVPERAPYPASAASLSRSLSMTAQLPPILSHHLRVISTASRQHHSGLRNSVYMSQDGSEAVAMIARDGMCHSIQSSTSTCS